MKAARWHTAGMSIGPEVERARARMAQLARAMLDGKLSFIEGAREIWRLGPEARVLQAEIAPFAAAAYGEDQLVGVERLR